MNRNLPPLTWIRSFEAAARHLSFTAAGDELGLTQAAVSQHIKGLEHMVGRPLFVRLTRALSLTEAGGAYFTMIQPLLDRMADGTEALFGGVARNSVVVRVSAAYSVLWLAARLPDFFARCPDVEVRLTNPIWPSLKIDDGADFDIRYGSGHWPGFSATRLTHDTFIAVASPNAGAVDIAHSRLIHVMGYRDGWADWLSTAGIKEVDTRSGLQCDNSIMAFQAAVAGVGTALGRRSLVSGHLARGDLVQVHDVEIAASEDYYLLASSRQPGPAAEAFQDWLLAEVEDVVGN